MRRSLWQWVPHVGVGGFLIMTHLVAATIALGIAADAPTDPAVPAWMFTVLALVAASVVGWVLTIELRRNIDLVESALQRIKDGQPVAEIPRRLCWPLTKLITLVDALGARERQYGALRQQMLTHTEQAAVQEERNRLARDLHDSIKQQLFSINVSTAAAQARWDNDPAAAQGALADVRRSAHEAMVEMRALLQQLRPAPLETVGLVEALRDQSEALGYRSGAQVTTQFGDLPGDDRLPPGAQDTIFRIAQEALGNVARHARAEHVDVQLQRHENALLLVVRDDGQGFDPQQTSGGMGLGNIRERVAAVGGTMDVESAPGQGTLLRVLVPLVEPLVQEDSMNAETKALVKRTLLWQVAGAVAVGLAVSRIGSMGQYLIGGVGQPRWTSECLRVGAYLVIALAFAVVAQRVKQQLVLRSGSASAPLFRLRTWEHIVRGSLYFLCLMGLSGMPLVTGGWLPTMSPPIIMPWQQALTVLIAIFFGALFASEVVRYFLDNMRYRAQLTPHELRRTLEQDVQSRRTNLFLTPLLIGLASYNAVSVWQRAGFPPQNADQWSADVTIIIIMTTICLFFVNVWRYIEDQRLLNHGVRV